MSIVMVSQLLLWIAVAVLGVLVAALARQVGVLHERIAPAGALTLHQSLKAGDAAPTLQLNALDGRELAIGGPSERSKLVLFVSPDCPICKSLLPVFKSVAMAERGTVDAYLASDGEEREHRAFITSAGLAQFPYVLSEELGRQFNVSKLPYAVLIAPDGTIASLGLINTREHLESLFEAQERDVHSIQDYLANRESRQKVKGLS
jgi:methylamine dehydrogenase accessory protein MauD